MARDPEDELRGIILTTLGRVGDDRGFVHALAAADAIIATLADEMPDGYDDLLRAPAERQQRDPVTIVSGDMAVELPGTPDQVVDLMAALERSVAAAKEARSRHPQPRLTGRVRAPGGDLEGTVDPNAGHGPHDGDVFIDWDDGESGWYDADTVERIL